MTIALISHPLCALHQIGEGHPECPDRYKVIAEALRRYPFHKASAHEAPLANRAQLITAHDEQYVDWIFSIAPKEGLAMLDADTGMNQYTLEAALRAAGAVIFAVDLVMKDEAQVAFCNIRPPGHHAERAQGMGFCFFNNVAIGVLHAIHTYGLTRIAIIDFDLHHGNGTQDIFQTDDRVLLCSSFEHPLYPGYDPEKDNHHILNVPLAAGTGGDVFRAKVKAAWFDRLNAFKPQFIFFSAGFDAHANDPLGNLQLTKADYVWLTKEIAEIAKVHCGGKMVSVLEGGYNLEALAECVPAHVESLTH